MANPCVTTLAGRTDRSVPGIDASRLLRRRAAPDDRSAQPAPDLAGSAFLYSAGDRGADPRNGRGVPVVPRRPPYLVLPPGGDLDAAARDVAQRGWRVHRGFLPPQTPWDLAPGRVVVVGVVDEVAAAQAALLCAVRGAGLVAAVDRDRPWAAGFLADLARLSPEVASAASRAAPTADSTADPAASPPDPPGPGPLTAEQRDLLDLLADGHSIAQAARLRYLSLRTANRRVAEARTALGVATTRDAVLAYLRLRGG